MDKEQYKIFLFNKLPCASLYLNLRLMKPDVEPFSIAVPLQRCLSTNEGLPRAPTQRRGTVATVSDQREKRIGGHAKNHEVQLLTADPHAEAHFVKWCTPRQIFIYRKSNGQEHEIALAQLFSILMVEHLLKMIFRNNGVKKSEM
ncbi:hypothetical protein P5673_003816 [Acropora cervicornis]|uniref:Uncharacterized protein n=1 Tax=Acropora cervicornis TaxID=6130 RepID=A0AAD9R159_ACRCE|nr:hypothetical protein P5673_003816 [Acropora cervicornis]